MYIVLCKILSTFFLQQQNKGSLNMLTNEQHKTIKKDKRYREEVG